jgi:hypothetical protein
MRLKWMTAAAAAAAVAGCAPAGTSPGPERDATVVAVASSAGRTDLEVRQRAVDAATFVNLDAPPDRVWAVLDRAYTDSGIPVMLRDPEHWTMGNRDMEISRRLNGVTLSHYFTCGSTSMGTEAADSYRLQVNVVSTVMKQGTGTHVETYARALARQVGTSSPPLNCTSTGALEKAIANRLSVLVAAG